MLHVQSPPSVQTSIDPCTKDPRAKGGEILFWTTGPHSLRYAFNLTRRGLFILFTILSTNLQLQDPRELVERVWLPVYKFEATVDMIPKHSETWLPFYGGSIKQIVYPAGIEDQRKQSAEFASKGNLILVLHLFMVSKRWQVCKTVLNWLRFQKQ